MTTKIPTIEECEAYKETDEFKAWLADYKAKYEKDDAVGDAGK